MKTSSTQVHELLETEQFRSKAYADGQTPSGVQLYSIGYGHQIQPNEQQLKRTSITKEHAMRLFQNDLLPLENQINKKSAFPLNQSQFDAMIDFGYNCGAGALLKILDTWNSTHSATKVADHMKEYNKTRVNGQLIVSKGLVERRLKNALAFMTDNPGTSALFVGAAVLGLFLLKS